MVIPILWCGFFGGIATIFGKLSFSQNWIIDFILKQCVIGLESQVSCYYVEVLIRIVAFIGIVACNLLIANYFLKSMEDNNTLVVIVISSATNFLTTGILGQLIFGETVTSTWYTGSCLITIGMILVSLSDGPSTESKKIKQPTASRSSVVVT
jgi:drug/metabolite transporter (DMT)-like permease